jgi:long-chain acyl-CoA synthetase
MSTLTFPGDWTTGHVGGVPPVCEVRLVDVPEMGYRHTDRWHGAQSGQGEKAQPCLGRGEIWVRGPNIFVGYFKMPDKTAETIDSGTGLGG